VIGFEEPLDVNGRSTFLPERFTDGENPRAFHLAVFYSIADEIGVLEHGSDVKDGRESPPSEHLLELRGDLCGGEVLGVKQSRQQDVHVAVPEASSHDEALAIDYGGAAWDSDSCDWPYGNNMAVVNEDRAVLDCYLCGGGKNPGANQSKIGGAGSAPGSEDPKDQN